MDKVFPVACPICGECQNILPGGFKPHAEPFGKVNCMVCNHQFSGTEYRLGLDARARAFATLSGPVPE